MELESGTTSGKRVIEAKGVGRAFGAKPSSRLWLRIQRGDRIRVCRPERGQDHAVEDADGRGATDEGTSF
jgi:ATP-binding cassette subfamily F protein uup